MKNKFLPGFLSGLLSSLLIVTLIFTLINVFNPDDKISSKPNAQISSESNGVGDSNEDNVTDEGNTTDKKLNKEAINKKLDRLENLIDEYYLEEIDEDAYADGIYKGFMDSLGDPYTVYYTKKEFAALQESSSGVYCGIGAYVSQNADTGIITIVKPFVKGPAYEAGILPGDIIYKVDGEEVTGKDLTEVVSHMKGTEGTKVKLTIVRGKNSEPIEITVERRKIEVPTIEYEMLDNNIGYISVTEFDEVTAEQFIDAVNTLDKKGQKGLIVDLRNNPGGLLDIVVKMLNRLLPKGLIVYTEDKNGEKEEFFSDAKEEFDKPLVVLINGNSASASEIFAGAIQDYGIGTLVGTTSFGKGIVQSVIPLGDKTAVKITISKYFTPKGRNIHGTGIEPDVKIDLSEELKQKVEIKKSEDNQLQKAIEVIKEKVNK